MDKWVDILKRLLSKRAERFGLSPSSLAARDDLHPQFLAANSDVLQHDLAELKKSDYPGPECLMPYELENLQDSGLDALSSQRLRHLKSCAACATLLAGALPQDEKVKQFLEDARVVAKHISSAAGVSC